MPTFNNFPTSLPHTFRFGYTGWYSPSILRFINLPSPENFPQSSVFFLAFPRTDYCCLTKLSSKIEGPQSHEGAGPLLVVVVVFPTLTRIIRFVVTGQAPVPLELKNTPGKNTNNPWAAKATELNRHTTRMKIRGSVVS